jgi:hypothetical protein
MKYGDILVTFALAIGLISSVDACGNDCGSSVKPKIAGDSTCFA